MRNKKMDLNKKIINFLQIHGRKGVRLDKENSVYKIQKIGDKILPLIERGDDKDLRKILDIIKIDLVFMDNMHRAFINRDINIPLINLAVQVCFIFSEKDIFAGSRYDYRLW